MYLSHYVKTNTRVMFNDYPDLTVPTEQFKSSDKKNQKTTKKNSNIHVMQVTKFLLATHGHKESPVFTGIIFLALPHYFDNLSFRLFRKLQFKQTPG